MRGITIDDSKVNLKQTFEFFYFFSVLILRRTVLKVAEREEA